jgi:hypothetical protein
VDELSVSSHHQKEIDSNRWHSKQPTDSLHSIELSVRNNINLNNCDIESSNLSHDGGRIDRIQLITSTVQKDSNSDTFSTTNPLNSINDAIDIRVF